MAIAQPRAQHTALGVLLGGGQHRGAGQTRFGPAVRELLDEGGALEAEGGKEAHAEDRGF